MAILANSLPNLNPDHKLGGTATQAALAAATAHAPLTAGLGQHQPVSYGKVPTTAGRKYMPAAYGPTTALSSALWRNS
jgi:hypothetical protein